MSEMLAATIEGPGLKPARICGRYSWRLKPARSPPRGNSRDKYGDSGLQASRMTTLGEGEAERDQEDGTPFDKLREECGVMAVYGHPDAARMTYWGLYALQHRGQESAGIASRRWPGR